MTDKKSLSTFQWTRTRTLVLSAVCLAVGLVGGRYIRGLQGQTEASAAPVTNVSASGGTAASPASLTPDPAQLKAMADAQAAPQLEKLKSDPANPEMLISVGNVYYDAQQYAVAIDFYARALKARPSDAAVRTDMATAYWYTGNADAAIAEFNKALSYEPNNPNTLFNLGLVKWKGKSDSAGAIADWEKLLAANPNYAGKANVQQMMAEARKNDAVKP